MKLTDHFDSDEFRCKCGNADCTQKPMDVAFVARLEGARKLAGVPFAIQSGYRCPEYNATLKGAVEDSAHTKAMAADVACNGSGERYDIVSGALLAGFRRIGIGKTFVHLDTDPEKPQDVIWLYK